MKYVSFDTYRMDEDEPIIRSCWVCNGAHEHLKKHTGFHICYACGRGFIFGRFLDSFGSAEELDAWLRDKLEHVEADDAGVT
jgi:hypothetical protein